MLPCEIASSPTDNPGDRGFLLGGHGTGASDQQLGPIQQSRGAVDSQPTGAAAVRYLQRALNQRQQGSAA